MSVESGEMVIKQTGSMAGDGNVDFTIDRERKAVAVEMTTALGKPFLSSRALETLVLQILPERGMVAFNSDSPKMLTDWTIFVNVGEQRFKAQIVKQGEVNGGAVVVELYSAEGR